MSPISLEINDTPFINSDSGVSSGALVWIGLAMIIFSGVGSASSETFAAVASKIDIFLAIVEVLGCAGDTIAVKLVDCG